ncbi:hypothetical protein VIMS_02960 [Mycobacterium marinum]|nr:hypothetical protein VIMS_02960 [Mycobacterium marinum]
MRYIRDPAAPYGQATNRVALNAPAAPVADADPGTGDIQLTHGPGRDRAQPAIEDKQCGARYRGADGYWVGVGL